MNLMDTITLIIALAMIGYGSYLIYSKINGKNIDLKKVVRTNLYVLMPMLALTLIVLGTPENVRANNTTNPVKTSNNSITITK